MMPWEEIYRHLTMITGQLSEDCIKNGGILLHTTNSNNLFNGMSVGQRPKFTNIFIISIISF